MTVQGLADALTELLENSDFADAVQGDADAALRPYDLDDHERAALMADAEAMAGVSGFSVNEFASLQAVRADLGSVGRISGPRLAGAVSRVTNACGEHGCCSWETSLK